MSENELPRMNLERWRATWLSRPWNVQPALESGTIEVNGVRGFLTVQDLVVLFNLASELPPGGTYVEIGSWLGLSAIVFSTGLLANVNIRARVFCVDTWAGSPEHQHTTEIHERSAFKTCERNIASAGVSEFVTLVPGESLTCAEQWAAGAIDMLFIDGDHSYAACRNDLKNWQRHLATGARILGHDAVPASGVERAVVEFCRERGSRAAVLPLPSAHYIWEALPPGAEPRPGWRFI